MSEVFFLLFRKELYVPVLNQISFVPYKITKNTLVHNGRRCLNFALINKKFYDHLKSKLSDLKKMYELYTTYSSYNYLYENPEKYFRRDTISEYRVDCPPILIDALNSGCHLPCTSYSKDNVIFEDIREIVRLMPNSIHSNIGQLRCRDKVTPFVTAVFNSMVPEEVLRFLLTSGCNPHQKYELNGYEIGLLEDVQNDNPSRYNLLTQILGSD